MSKDIREYDYIFKLIVIGDSGVGKSCLLRRYDGDPFEECFIGTIGLDFRVRTITLHGKRIRLQLWDTAGQECFRPITTHYYRGTHGVLICYDITNKESFTNIDEIWLREFRKHTRDNVPRILVGNKSDLDDRRSVEQSEAKDYADEMGIPFLETSAKNFKNVENAFTTLVGHVITQNKHLHEGTRDSITLKDMNKIKDEPEGLECKCI